MHISIKWFDGKYPSFNVSLHAKEGAEEFLTVKGCRIATGANGAFVSWPSTKNQDSGKYWNHVWANEKFAAAVLEKAQASQPKEQEPAKPTKGKPVVDDHEDDLDF